MNEILNIEDGDKEAVEKMLYALNDHNKKIAAQWMVDHWESALRIMLEEKKLLKQVSRK